MKKYSWIVALLMALTFTLFTGCGFDPLPPADESNVTYTEVDLPEFNFFAGQAANQKGWATDGRSGSEVTEDMGYKLADFQAAKYLVVEMANKPSQGIGLAWGANESALGGWNSAGNATTNSGETNLAKGTVLEGEGPYTLKFDLSLALDSYSKFTDPSATALSICFNYYGGVDNLGITRIYLMIQDEFNAVTSVPTIPATGKVGVDFVLPTQALPATATNRDIVWTLKSITVSGTTTANNGTAANTAVIKTNVAFEGNVIKAKVVLSAVVSGTVKDGKASGSDYVTQDYTINFVAPTNALEIRVNGYPKLVEVLMNANGSALSTTADKVSYTNGGGYNTQIYFQVNLDGFTQADIKQINLTPSSTAAQSGKPIKVQLSNDAPADYIGAGAKNFDITVSGTAETFLPYLISGSSNTSTPFVALAIHDNAQDYSFEAIEINCYPSAEEPFVPVASISGVPGLGAFGEEVDLSKVTILPSRATNKDIVWSVEAPSGQLIMAGVDRDKFTAVQADGKGFYVITATIKDGLAEGVDYKQEFNHAIDFAFPEFNEPANSVVKAIDDVLDASGPFQWAVDNAGGTKLIKGDGNDYVILAVVLAGSNSGFGTMQLQLQGSGINNNTGQKGMECTNTALSKVPADIVYLVFDLGAWANYQDEVALDDPPDYEAFSSGWMQFRINWSSNLTTGLMQAYFVNIGQTLTATGSVNLTDNGTFGATTGNVFGFASKNFPTQLTEK